MKKTNQSKEKQKQQQKQETSNKVTKSSQPITSDEDTDDTLVIDQSIKKKGQNGNATTTKNNNEKQNSTSSTPVPGNESPLLTSSHHGHSHDGDGHGHSHDGGGHGHSHGGQECHGHSHGESNHTSSSTALDKPKNKYKTVIKFALLFLMVPLLFSMPLILRSAGEAVANNRFVLYYIWAVYAVVWAALIYHKRKTNTISSFVNHNLTWLIAALGAFIVLDIPKMIQQVDLRREVLFVWCTITWIPNVILYYFDDTNYHVQEAKEEERSQRKKIKDEEKRAKLEEKRLRRQKERMDRYTPKQRMLLNASIYFGLALLVVLLAWQTYRWYLKTQQNIQERIRQTPGHIDPEPEFNFHDE